MEDTAKATREIRDKYKEKREYRKWDHFIQVRKDLDEAIQKLESVREDLKMESEGSDGYTRLKGRKRVAKGTKKILENEQQQLKEELKYESPSDSSDDNDVGGDDAEY